jgi:hypothetical protein
MLNYRGPFDPQLLTDLDDPFRLAFLSHVPAHYKGPQREMFDGLMDVLTGFLPKLWHNLTDALGTSLMNVQGKTLKRPIKSLFAPVRKRRRIVFEKKE